MSNRGSIIVGELQGKVTMLDVACHRCERRCRVSLSRLIDGARLIHRLKTHFGVRMIAVILENTMGIMNFAKRRGLSLAVAAALVTAAGAAPSIAYAQHHGGGGGISTGAAVGLGLGAFALGSAAGAGAYGYPYGYGYGYYPPTAYYPPAPAYYAPRSCWDPYYRRYYAC